MREPRLLSFFFLLLLSFAGAASRPAAGQTAGPSTEVKGIEPVVHALCGKRVALLGESPVHGFGETLEFKAELVRRLVDRCHYSALFVESGTYDFIHMGKSLKSGQDVTDATISAAIGGIWSNKEVQSLVPFLKEKVMAGSLTLGGLDDQVGRGTYASRDMASELAQYLEGSERSRCLGILQRHLFWQYRDDAPYDPSDREKIVGCLNVPLQSLVADHGSWHSEEEFSFAFCLSDDLQEVEWRNYVVIYHEEPLKRTPQKVLHSPITSLLHRINSLDQVHSYGTPR